MYNFNISRHGCYNFSIIRFNQIRNEHRKRKRRVDHLKIIKNVSSSDKISQQFSTVRAILNQRENNITTNNVSTNSNGLQQISELCDETEEDMKIIEYQLTSLCESLEKSSRFNSTFDEQKNNSFCSIMKINDISDLNENNEDVRSVVESQKLEMRDVFIETAYIFPNYESEQLPTFKTASGKQVNFNNKSLLMAKKLFDSVTENVETNKHFSVLEESLENNAENSVKNLNLDDLEIAGTSKAESHFQTNGRKPRNVTNKLNAPDFKQIDFKFDMCSSKANSTCSNYSTSKPNYNENLIIKENNLLNNGEDDINRQFVSFGGVSEKSLNTAEKLLGYVEEDLTENIPNWDETVHFNTSNELFNFDENILNEFSNDGYLDKQEKLKEYEKDRKGIHESTPVDVNKDSFTRKKKSLEDNIILENTNNKLKTIDIVNTDIKNLPGFSTACGKQLIVNEKSLLKVKKLFENISCEIEKEIPEFLHTDSLKHLIDQKVTTNVKRRNIAEKSSIVANKLFDCEEMEKADDPQKAKIKTSASQTLEFFSTASGKQIDVREQSLQTAQKLFDSIFKDTEEDVNVFDNESTKKENCIFSTVKRRRMEVNEDLLLKNKLPKIKEMYNAEDINTQNIIENKFIPFNINDTKRIHIDEQLPFATEKLNETQQNIDQRFNMKGIINSQLAAFHTANGKQINITEKSLQLAKKLFEDVDKDRETIKSQENLTSSLKNDQPMNDVDQNNKCTQFHTKKFIAKSKELLSNFFKNNAEKNTEEQFREIKMRSDVAINVRPLIEFKGSSDDVRKTIDVREKLIDFTKNKLNDEFKDQKVENYCTNFNEDFEHEIAQTCKQVLEYKSIESAVLTDAKVMDFHLQDAEKKNPVYDVVETSLTSNVSREVTESTSAFLFDMNCDTSFIPVDDVSFNSFNLPEKKEMEMEKQHSKPSSPVFESNKISRRKKNKKRRSQCSLSLTPLNVTYMRKENDDVLDSRTSSEDIFKMFKDNFAQKSVKRKESVSDMVYPLSKKAKKSDYKVELSDKRKQAAIDQQTYINTKDRESCKPNCGRYLSEKLNGKRNTLRETVNNERPQRYQTDKLLQLGLKRSVIAVSSENAEDFVFTSDFLNSAHVNCVYDTYGDDCKVIPNENNEVHFENLARAFLASPGVDPVLITLPWIRNHYRWIIWKLASTEKSFPHIFGAKYLTLDNALFQLKFRYDFEIDRCQRSALKCILEFDDSASKPIILCIATLKESTTSLGEYEMELTDGWYNIRCQIDSEMNKLICKKKVTIGTKLLIMNAELIGANEGCDPLQIKDNVRLKIASNSVRRVRWDTRLGFYFGRTMILQDIRAVLSNGGMISQVLTVIVRVYPLLYLEKKDNCSVLYNEKTYLKKTTDYEKKRQVYLENLVSQVTAEVRKENYLSDSDEYRNFSQSEIDPEILQAERFGEQEKLRILIEERVRNKLPEEFKELRPTSRLLKIRLINNEDSVLPLSALLTIWHPSEDLISLLYEGKLYSLQNIIANGYRNGELQLSTSRMTKYESLSIAPKTTKYRRCVTKFDELKNDFTSVFGEIDTVGIVFGVEDSTSENDKYRNQTVYLADLEQNILAVVFRSSIKNFGYEDTFKRKGIIGCLNLQWKRGFLYWKIPVVFVSEFTSFVHKSHHKHLQKYLDKFDTHFKNQCIDSFLMECDKKLKTIISLRPVATSTPLKICSKTTSAENTDTVAVKTSTSVFKHKSSECSFDSHNSSRNTGSKSVQSRIEKLRGYGEPPSLSPISLSTCRKRVGRLSVQTRVFKSSCDKT